MSWAQNVLGTESLIWAQNVQAQNRRLKIAGTESLGTKSGTFMIASLAFILFLSDFQTLVLLKR